MEQQVTIDDIRELEALLVKTHARHASQYGPIPSCTQEDCLQTKLGIAWLYKVLGRDGTTDNYED